MFLSYFITFKTIDRGLLEYFGPLGIVRASDSLSAKLIKLHSGLVYRYIFLIIPFLLIGLTFAFFVSPDLLLSYLKSDVIAVMVVVGLVIAWL